jgi:hypothetical protein
MGGIPCDTLLSLVILVNYMEENTEEGNHMLSLETFILQNQFFFF